MFKITLPRRLDSAGAIELLTAGAGSVSGRSRQGAAAVGFAPAMTAREGACALAAGMAGIGVAGAGGGAGGISVATHAYQYCMGRGPGWMYI